MFLHVPKKKKKKANSTKWRLEIVLYSFSLVRFYELSYNGL